MSHNYIKSESYFPQILVFRQKQDLDMFGL